jgi:hypothetical protein
MLRRLRPRAAEDVTVMHHLEPVRLAALLRQVPGKWVAIHDGEIVVARDTFDQVVMDLNDRNITDATIMRSPAEHEVELVGMG